MLIITMLVINELDHDVWWGNGGLPRRLTPLVFIEDDPMFELLYREWSRILVGIFVGSTL